MNLYSVKYAYFDDKVLKYGYVTVRTESEDENEIVELAKDEARGIVGSEVKILTIDPQ